MRKANGQKRLFSTRTLMVTGVILVTPVALLLGGCDDSSSSNGNKQRDSAGDAFIDGAARGAGTEIGKTAADQIMGAAPDPTVVMPEAAPDPGIFQQIFEALF